MVIGSLRLYLTSQSITWHKDLYKPRKSSLFQKKITILILTATSLKFLRYFALTHLYNNHIRDKTNAFKRVKNRTKI